MLVFRSDGTTASSPYIFFVFLGASSMEESQNETVPQPILEHIVTPLFGIANNSSKSQVPFAPKLWIKVDDNNFLLWNQQA